jgi:hypothetical protein
MQLNSFTSPCRVFQQRTFHYDDSVPFSQCDYFYDLQPSEPDLEWRIPKNDFKEFFPAVEPMSYEVYSFTRRVYLYFLTFTVKIEKWILFGWSMNTLYLAVSVSFFTTVPNGLQLRWLSGRSH